ncbi:hypothetical protein BU15DRAFT_63840 [Melanogaster broomeanus]|nr:hypothetical protein BU15DRAFT_63840 [Melanogaster broomeanus]
MHDILFSLSFASLLAAVACGPGDSPNQSILAEAYPNQTAEQSTTTGTAANGSTVADPANPITGPLPPCALEGDLCATRDGFHADCCMGLTCLWQENNGAFCRYIAIDYDTGIHKLKIGFYARISDLTTPDADAAAHHSDPGRWVLAPSAEHRKYFPSELLPSGRLLRNSRTAEIGNPVWLLADNVGSPPTKLELPINLNPRLRYYLTTVTYHWGQIYLSFAKQD